MTVVCTKINLGWKGLKTKEIKVTVYPILPDFRKSTDFIKFHRFRPFVRPLSATFR